MNDLRKPFNVAVVLIIISTSMVACHKKESGQAPTESYVNVTDADIITCIKTVFPKEQIGLLKTSAERRKKVIENLQSTFAVARAAQEAGFEQTESFQKHFSAGLTRLLATEFTERYANYKINDEDIKYYANAHKNDFERELKFLNYRPDNSEDIEKAKFKWSELQIRADLGQQKGLDKEANVQLKSRLLRADILANMYFNKTEEQYTVKDSDLKDYYKQHPETNPYVLDKR